MEDRFSTGVQELEHIFANIRDAIWTNAPSPDFSGIKKDDHVLALFIVLRAVCRERIIAIIDQPTVDWKIIYQRACTLRDVVHEPRNLALLFYHDLLLKGLPSALKRVSLFQNLIRSDLNAAYAYGEMLERVRARRIGAKAFDQLMAGKESHDDIFTEILESLDVGFKNKRKIKKLKSYDAHFEDKDFQQEARLGAWNYWHGIKAALYEEFQLPQSVIRLPTSRRALWRTLNPVLLLAEGRACSDRLLPILRGHWEELPGKAHQALKDLWEKRKAQKRDGTECAYDAYTAEPEYAHKQHEEWQRKENGSVDVQDQIARIINTAKENLGDKAAKAFQHRLNVDTDKEAAQLAGITERTYRNYLSAVSYNQNVWKWKIGRRTLSRIEKRKAAC